MLQALHLYAPETAVKSVANHVTKCLELSSLGCYVDASAPRFRASSTSSGLVSEQQHIWLFKPSWVKISAVVQDYLPRKGSKNYSPSITCQIRVGEVEVCLNSTYLKALMSLLAKCQIYENVLLSRVRKLESANALELRSEKEYEALLKSYHVLLLAKDPKVNLQELVKAETQLSITDLKQLWSVVLEEADSLDSCKQTDLSLLLKELREGQTANIGDADEVLFEDMAFEPCLNLTVRFENVCTYLVLGSKAQHVVKCTIRGLNAKLQNNSERAEEISEQITTRSQLRLSVMEARAVKGKGYAYVLVKQGEVSFKTSLQWRGRDASIVFNEAVLLSIGEAFTVELYRWQEFTKDVCLGRSHAIMHSTTVQSPFWVQCFSGDNFTGELLISAEFSHEIEVKPARLIEGPPKELRFAFDMEEVHIFDEHEVEHIQLRTFKFKVCTLQRQVLARALGGSNDVRVSMNLTIDTFQGLLSRAHIEYMIRAYHEVVGLSVPEEAPLTKEYRALSFQRSRSSSSKSFRLVEGCPLDADIKVTIRRMVFDAAQSPSAVSVGTAELKRLHLQLLLKEELSLFLAVDWFGFKIKDKAVYPLSRQGDRMGSEREETDEDAEEDDLPRNPMLTMQVELPFMFAYHWNVTDRGSGEIPAGVTSCMQIKAVVKDVYAEFPACLEVMSPMICGLHPIVELIEIEIPTLALSKMAFSVDLCNLLVIGSPVLYPQGGSAAIVAEISSVFEGIVDCADEADVENWRMQVDFQCAVGSLSNRCREWRKRHTLVFPCELLLSYGYSCNRAEGAVVTITSNKSSTLSTSLWVKDVALCYAVNTANRIYLKQFVETAQELTKSTRRRQSRSFANSLMGNPEAILLPLFSQQQYLRLPYKFVNESKTLDLGFEGYQQHFRVVLGVGDFPLVDLALDVSAKLMKEQKAVGFECTVQGTFFNSKKHVWEPLIERKSRLTLQRG